MSGNTQEKVLASLLTKYTKKIKSFGVIKDVTNCKSQAKAGNSANEKKRLEDKPTVNDNNNKLIPATDDIKNSVELSQAELAKEALAGQMRKDGNTFYKRAEYVKAHFYYTKSIQAAVKPLTKAMGYANRSASLFHSNLYDECILDVGKALKYGYPDNLKYKLYLRMVRCQKYLHVNCHENWNNIIQAIETHNKTDSTKLQKVIIKELCEGEPYYAVEILKPFKWELPKLCFKVNNEVPCFSSAVSFATSKEHGRHVIANRDIMIGDVLVVEAPISHSLGPENTHLYCAHCCKLCFTPEPCQYCQYAVYCNERCKELDWDLCHKDSCSLVQSCYSNCTDQPYAKESFSPEWISRTESLVSVAYRLICLLGPENIISRLNLKAPDYDEPTQYFSPLAHDQIGSTMSLLFILYDQMKKFNGLEVKIFTAAAIQIASSFDLPAEEKELMAAVAFKFMVAAKNNAKEIKHTSVSFRGSSYGTSIAVGFGLYLASSFINHSCDPNMVAVSYGSSVVFSAIRPIKAGEQLTHSYSDSINVFKTHGNRQEQIKKYLNFTCNCHICMKGLSVSTDPEEHWNLDIAEFGPLLSVMGLPSRFWKPFMLDLCASKKLVNISKARKRAQFLHHLIVNGKQDCRVYFCLLASMARQSSIWGNASFDKISAHLLFSQYDIYEYDLVEMFNQTPMRKNEEIENTAALSNDDDQKEDLEMKPIQE